jgi:large subunit ribosomal protein L30
MTKIAVIRIKGMIGLKKEIAETLHRLRLRKKYVCVVLENPTPAQFGMIKSVRNTIAYGEINEETYKQLKEKRGLKDPKNPGKIKPYFRLHPPRGGIDTKKHFGVHKGVLGDNKEKINDLILRML